MNEKDRWGLHGAVRICETERSWYGGAQGGDISRVEFRPDGAIARRWHRNPDGSEWTAAHEYSDDGRLTLVRNGTSDQVYEYDASERLVRVTDARVIESYEYDSGGHKKKTIYVDPARQQMNCSWGVEGSDCGYSARGAATLTTLYNEREKPAELCFYDANGSLLSRVNFHYDPNGNLMEEAQSEVAELLGGPHAEAMRALFGGGFVRRAHRYDEKGRRIETLTAMGMLGENTKTVAYNDQDDPKEEVVESKEREFGIDDEGRLSEVPGSERVSRSETRFRYDYDSHGNWTTKTIEGRGGADQDFTTSSVEKRTIDYFD